MPRCNRLTYWHKRQITTTLRCLTVLTCVSSVFVKWFFFLLRFWSEFYGNDCSTLAAVRFFLRSTFLFSGWRANLSTFTFTTLHSITRRLPQHCKVPFSMAFCELHVTLLLNLRARQWQWKDEQFSNQFFFFLKKAKLSNIWNLGFCRANVCIYIYVLKKQPRCRWARLSSQPSFQSALETYIYIFFVLTTAALVWPANAAATVPVRHGEHAR